MTVPVPSVWPTGANSLDVQLEARGYHHATGTDSTPLTPVMAEYAIAALTQPGDIVLDPDCGAGITVVEALRAGRHAIGLTVQRKRWRLARANVTAAKALGAPTDGMVLVPDRRPGTAAAAETAGLAGRVNLLLTSLRSFGPASSPADECDRLWTLLNEYRTLVRPGGYVAIGVAPQRHPARHELIDLPSEILAIGVAAGLAPIARCLALTADVRGRRVHTRATVVERREARLIERLSGCPVGLCAHHTVVVFRVDPDAADATLALPIPPMPALPRRRHIPRERLAASISYSDLTQGVA